MNFITNSNREKGRKGHQTKGQERLEKRRREGTKRQPQGRNSTALSSKIATIKSPLPRDASLLKHKGFSTRLLPFFLSRITEHFSQSLTLKLLFVTSETFLWSGLFKSISSFLNANYPLLLIFRRWHRRYYLRIRKVTLQLVVPLKTITKQTFNGF